MGRKPITRVVVCVDCGARDELGARSAEKLGWMLWPGGGRCPACERKRVPRAQPSTGGAELARHPPPPTVALVKLVRCAECGKEFTSEVEGVDGWRPAIHWTITDETKRALREQRKPVPLCPGFYRAGVLLGERART